MGALPIGLRTGLGADVSVLGWVAVPGGRNEPPAGAPEGADRSVAVLRVLVVPKLDEQLAATALADWPATINAVTPVVEVREPGHEPVRVSSELRRAARSSTWQGFFGHGIDVRPWQPPAGYDPPDVSPTLQHVQDVRTTYKSAADRPGDAGVVRQQLGTWQAVPPPSRGPAGAPVFAPVDLHRAVSMLREHPYVLRMLGLILELEIAAGDVPRTAGSERQIRVTWPESPLPVESPWTAYEYNGEHFLPASGGDIVRGLVDLSDEHKWEIVTADIEGAVSKLRDAARAVLGDGRTADDTDVPVLPTLKSAGLQLARRDRAEQLADRTRRGRSNATTRSLADHVFTADDLVLGYRIDVRPQSSNTWYSLHDRTATYTIDGAPVGADPAVREEGHVKPHAAVKDDTGLRAEEIVARWSGWSLAVARPTFEGRQPIEGPTDSAADLIPYRFAMSFDVTANSLPELRFGEAYQLRARVLDVAGGGLQLDDPEAAAQPTGLVPYTRYEPVPPPELVVPDGLLVPDAAHPERTQVARDRLGPGGALERLVVRSSPTATGAFSGAEFDGNPAYPQNNRRTCQAPATTFQLAEQHGVFAIPDEAGWSRALRANPLDPTSRLPDPLALGPATTLVPEPGGLTDAITDTRPWAGTWPDLEPKVVELVAGSTQDAITLHWVASGAAIAPAADAQSSTVRVVLPPGQHAVLELSSMILQGNLDLFEIKQLASTAEADTAAIQGRHPMLTPPRRIELVHAVRQPIKAPTGSLATSRPIGATYAVLEPTDALLGIDTSSTAQLDITAAWDEWGGPVPVASPATPLPPTAVARGAEELPELRQEFGDTKHRMVRYTVAAVSRYRDFFAASDPEALFRVTTPFDAVSVKNSARPAPPVIVSTLPAFLWSDSHPQPGRLVRTRAGGRLRLDLGNEWFTTGEGECLGVVVWPGTDDIPNEVRGLVSWVNRDPIHQTPSPPKVLADESMFTGTLGPVDVRLIETGHPVRVLPYPVSFDDGRWFADVEMPVPCATSYSPFAHLAVVRFQRESLPDLSISTVVRTDMVPVPNDRRLEVHQEADGLHAALSGLGPEGSRPNRVVAALERRDGTAASVGLTSLTGTAPPGVDTWVRVPGASVVGRTNEPLPALPVPADTGHLRVVIREVEDLDAPGGIVGAARELAEHAVYVDAVDLPIG